jgi:hypothetical protein
MVASIKRERGPLPGEVAQVDFGYAGKLWDPESGKLRKAWVFVMVLGYSRHRFDKVVFNQKTETWIALHEEAFRSFGGVPEVVVPDNLKAAVIRAAFGVGPQPAELNRSYRELARHYGFKVDPAPPKAPEKKGKVEAGVKYVKRNALSGRDGQPIDEVNSYLTQWVREVAGQRIHGTTGRRPLEVFEAEEVQKLLPLPLKRYEAVMWKQATVHRDSHVVFDGRLYSVPWKLIGRSIWVCATPTTVSVYFDDERIATHCRNNKGPRSTEEHHLPEHRVELRHRSRSYWEQRAKSMGDDVLGFVREVFDSDDVLLQLRQVQAIVTHVERFPPERAQAACRRASLYGSFSFQAIKNILLKALDREPLPAMVAPTTAWVDLPRFARRPQDWVAKQGGSNEQH